MNTLPVHTWETQVTKPNALGRFQFSLRTMFVAITLSAISLAVLPKDERVIPWLFNLPQFALAAWAFFRGLRPAAGQRRKDTQLSFGFYGVSLAIGLILPTIVSFLMLDWINDAVLAPIIFTIFSLLALEPLCIVVGLCGPVRGARLPLALLHAYNVLAIIAFYVFMTYIYHCC